MSFDFPANVERDIELYALSQHISPSDAVVKLVQDALKAKKRKSIGSELTEDEWKKLKDVDPSFAFFSKMPDTTVEKIAEATRQSRAERFTPRDLRLL